MDILIVDDHRAMRDELVSLISSELGPEVVVQAETGEEGVEKALAFRPDVVVMDMVLPGMNGLEASKAILEKLPETQILVVSNHHGRSLVQKALAVGAAGYLRKDRAYEELVTAIRTLATGGRYLGDRIVD